MNVRAASRLAWALAGLSAAMFGGSVVFASLALLAEDAPPLGMVGNLVLFLPFLAFPGVGALIASRRPGNPIGWICLAVGLFWMLIGVIEAYDAYTLARYGRVWSPVTLDAATQWIWVPPVGLLGIYMILLFPDGRLPSRRWRPLAWFSGALMVLISVGFAFVPGPLMDREGVRNPLGLEWLAGVADVAIFVILLLPLCILASALSLVIRYRRATDEVRQQIKWLAFAASFVGVTYLGSLLGQLLFAPESLQAEGVPPLWTLFADNLVLLSYAGVPVAVGIAVLKYRLYDIDFIVNRALVYGTLTATLATTYFVGVVLLQGAFRALTGQGSQLAIVASTLLIAALFGSLRYRVQIFVDRHFYRSKYDAARILGSYSTRLRDETDLDSLGDDLAGVIRETVQPAHVSLWLREPGPGREIAPQNGRAAKGYGLEAGSVPTAPAERPQTEGGRP